MGSLSPFCKPEYRNIYIIKQDIFIVYLRQEDKQGCESFRVVDYRFQQPPMPSVKNVEEILAK